MRGRGRSCGERRDPAAEVGEVKDLILAPGLSLPREVVTQTFGILAVRGAGKTNTAAVLAEQMYEAGLPFVVVDPVGSWWGLRSWADGKPGLSLAIFGGRHGDVPLERSAGHLLADLAVDERLSFVLDISEFSEADKTRFLIDFAERLYRRNEAPLHLFLEEADDYAPQRPFREQARLLRAWENVVRRGRARGLGITMITQRSAALNKNVLTQIETLVVLRTTSPQDRKAIQAWVEYHGQSRELIESLPGLQDGEAWVWSPSWLKTLKRVRMNRRQTFDSGATPKGPARARPPATLADVDLGAIQARMKETIERAKKEDPRELRRRIAELEARKPAAAPAPIEKRVEVPILKDAQLRRLEVLAGRMERQAEALINTAKILKLRPVDVRQTFSPRAFEAAAHKAPLVARPVRTAASNGGGPLKAGARRMLAALAARHPTPLSRQQVGTLAGISTRGGTFSDYLSMLRTSGYVAETSSGLQMTSSGLECIGSDVESVPDTTDALMAMWLPRFKAGARRMLTCVVENPGGMTREQLGELAGISTAGGTFADYLSALRTNDLIDERDGVIRPSRTLFP